MDNIWYIKENAKGKEEYFSCKLHGYISIKRKNNKLYYCISCDVNMELDQPETKINIYENMNKLF